MDTCLIEQKFDGHYTPECVNDHGQRLNIMSKADRFKFCPFCGKRCEALIIDPEVTND